MKSCNAVLGKCFYNLRKQELNEIDGDEEIQILIQENDKERKIETNIITAFELKRLGGFYKLTSSYSFILPIAYFISSISAVFILILINCIRETNPSSFIENFPFHPFPKFYEIKNIQPLIFSSSICLVAVLGIFNVWFYCSMLLQRFSVPELQSKKLVIHFMFILGIMANSIFVFFGFSEDLIKRENVKIRDISISISTIIFLIFIYFNILFAVMSVKSLQSLIQCMSSIHKTQKCKEQDNHILRNLKRKRSIIYLAIFLTLIYISGVAIKNHRHLNENSFDKNHKNDLILDLVLFVLPYLIYIINAFINLGYYSEIIYIQDNLTTIIDKEYFIYNEDGLLTKQFDNII